MKALVFLAALSTGLHAQTPDPGKWVSPSLRYMALGDSYTICEGAKESESWPVLLAAHLTQSGKPTVLVANPSRTGWTTRDLIRNELPVYDKIKPDFVTLLIGVNDWVQGKTAEEFTTNLRYILDHVQAQLSSPSKMMLITIPDFSVVPAAAYFGNAQNISKGIAAFNQIILAEGKQRKIAVVDIFALSQKMKGDATLQAADGLHPSAKEYALWEKLIAPVAEILLGECKKCKM